MHCSATYVFYKKLMGACCAYLFYWPPKTVLFKFTLELRRVSELQVKVCATDLSNVLFKLSPAFKFLNWVLSLRQDLDPCSGSCPLFWAHGF